MTLSIGIVKVMSLEGVHLTSCQLISRRIGAITPIYGLTFDLLKAVSEALRYRTVQVESVIIYT